ncbi:hypothetical protein NECID01_0255 [Nematocida sp. AWRm77]|nr:hypothetical protein NECID01_0255 [Nematocida sp. AWRm77]
MHERRSRHSAEHSKASYNNFMTEKEKDFVAFLFERANKKKERTSPDFYTKPHVSIPEHKKKEAIEKKVFEGILGKATRKSTKKIDTENNEEKSFIIKKRILSRSKIEDIHNVLNKHEMFIEKSDARDSTDKEDTAEVCTKLKEIGEDLFNTDKGLDIVRKLLALKKPEYEKSTVNVLIDRIKYVTASLDFCRFLSELLPVLTKHISKHRLGASPEVLADNFTTNASGVIVGNVVLAIYRKENPSMFSTVSVAMYKMLDETRLKRLFSKVSHDLIWTLFSAVVKGTSPAEAKAFKKKLEPKITADLNSKSAKVVENVRLFMKKCSGK